jgi:hypothetical protein
VNTPELSAVRGGGLSQGLPANGPYKSLFRARSRSASHGSGNKAAAAPAADAALHVLAEAAQSPEALSPVSTASPVPTAAAIITITPTATTAPATITSPAPTSVPTSKKRRKPSPLIAASPPPPASSVAPLDSSISVVRPSPAVSNASVSSSYVIVDPSRPPRQPRAKPGNGGGSRGGPGGGSTTTGKNKRKERVPPPPPAAQGNGNGEVEQRYERRSSSRPQSGSPFPAVEFHESESTVQGRSRNKQKNRAGSKDVGLPPTRPPPAPVDDGNYDHAQGYYYEIEPSGASNTVHEGRQSLSPPPPKTWESPRPTPPVVDHYPTSARTTSKESSPAPMTESRLQTPGTKPRMVTLLIEDRRLATDELVEVHVPLKAAGEGYLWADAKDVCAALQSGPSRIDGVSLPLRALRLIILTDRHALLLRSC